MEKNWTWLLWAAVFFFFLLEQGEQNRPPFSDNSGDYDFDAEDDAEIEEEHGHTGIQIAGIHTTSESEFLMAAIGAIMIATFSRFILEILDIHIMPESALVIVLGFFLGLIIWAAGHENGFDFDNEIFFLILIPPIIFESGYHMDRPSFFANVRLILMYALLGTAIVAGFMGGVLYWAKDTYDVDVSVAQTLTFGSLIAAVDPVAVISIFHEMHVNETLHILVFGESLLNDAISIVLYNVFLGLEGVKFTWDIPFLAFSKFLYVACGGLVFGITIGLLTCFFLRFMKPEYHLHVVEALVIVVMGWMSFLAAETFLMSGIVSCLFAGVIMNRYGERNLHPHGKITTNYVLYILAGTTETIIFVFLGMQSLFTPFAITNDSTWDSSWDTGSFVCLTVVLILPIRFILTFGMGYFENLSRLNFEKVKNEDFFIISYGGLRGAIAFALAWELPQDWEARNLMINAVIVTIWFTVFVQGGTIGPFIRWFRVRTKEEHELSLSEQVLPRVFPHVTTCMREIYGKHRAGPVMKLLGRLDKFLESLILREQDPEAELREAMMKADEKVGDDSKKQEEVTLKNFTKATRMYKGPIGKAPDIEYQLDMTNRNISLRETFYDASGRGMRASVDRPRGNSFEGMRVRQSYDE